MPAVYSNRLFVTSGGLLSYSPDRIDQFRKAAGYVNRILQGEKPADLPVQSPTKYELVINLKTAKAWLRNRHSFAPQLGADQNPEPAAHASRLRWPERRCRMHGGGTGSGGPKGARNGNYKQGRYTAEAIASRRWLRRRIREVRALTRTSGRQVV